jgi:murein DD-endopeptidase MepM/ murein hydrolase activator NlpD
LVVAMMVLAACAGKRAGVRHTVQRGESLYRIGQAYGVSHTTLARLNGIGDPNRIEVGQVIVIPDATRPLPVGTITPERARADPPAPPELPAGPSPFLWPVASGSVSSEFGPRGSTHHDGIDISSPEGTPVRAARTGRVLYSDRLRGYGNLVILEHEGGWATVYAHNRENQAAVGARVRQGDVIGEVGQTGKTSGPNLHFEIRKDNVARNPRFFLPTATAAGPAEWRADAGRDVLNPPP